MIYYIQTPYNIIKTLVSRFSFLNIREKYSATIIFCEKRKTKNEKPTKKPTGIIPRGLHLVNRFSV